MSLISTDKSSLQMINKWKNKTNENAKLQYAYIKILDRQVYLINKNILKDYKFLSYTYINYLTDFDIMNIYCIWMSHLKWVFCIKNIQINKTIIFNSDNFHLNFLIITEIKIFICIVEISDLLNNAQADFNYWIYNKISDYKFFI